MIGHCSRFREIDDSPPWRGPAVKKKPPFSNARSLITRKIMCSMHDILRTFAGKFSNVDFFLKLLLLKDDELVISEI